MHRNRTVSKWTSCRDGCRFVVVVHDGEYSERLVRRRAHRFARVRAPGADTTTFCLTNEPVLGRLRISPTGAVARSGIFHFGTELNLKPARWTFGTPQRRGQSCAHYAGPEIPLVFRIEDGWVSRRMETNFCQDPSRERNV